MLSCNDLLNLDIFKNIKLVAGKDRIYKSISWPYICQTLDFSQWVNGGELMFLTGMGMDISEEKIIDLIYECEKKDISGLVILTNSEYITNISINMINIANKVGLPLLEMPWNIKLIDVTREIANHIIELNLNQNKEKEILNQLIFSHDLDEKIISNLINENKFNLNSYFYVAKFKLLENTNKIKISVDYILNMIKSMLDKYNFKSISSSYEDEIICILELDNRKNLINHKKSLLNIQKQVMKYINVSLSIGSVYDSIFNVKHSFDEVNKIFNLYNCNGWDLEIIDYEKIGFYKILLEVSNHNKLKQYCYDVLGNIIRDDKNYDLLKTLRFYLKNNCNLINTSREMFIHRNTLIYRLNKIKNELKDNLEDPNFKNELMNAIMIYDYLKAFDDSKRVLIEEEK